MISIVELSFSAHPDFTCTMLYVQFCTFFVQFHTVLLKVNQMYKNTFLIQ